MRTIEEHKNNTHLYLDGLTVRNLNNSRITEIHDDVDALKNAHNTLAQETRDYWSELAADNNITPEEKKILYKEWIIIQDEYNALLEEALKNGIAESTQELINYKKEYQYLYQYLIVQLKIFNDMAVVTVLSDRETFIQMYNSYYGARDALRVAITDGIVADTESGLQGQIDKVVEDLQGVTQGGVADGSITVDKLASDVKNDIVKFEQASAIGFLTEDILSAIDTADLAVKKELRGVITSNEKSTKLYFEQLADRMTTLIDDANRKTRSRVTQTTDEFKIEIIDMANKTSTQFKQTSDKIEATAQDLNKEIAAQAKVSADAIEATAQNLDKEIKAQAKISADAVTAMASDLRNETSAAVKVQSDRITNMVTSGNTDAYLSLSVGIPYFLTESKFKAWTNLFKDENGNIIDQQGIDALNAIYTRANTGTEEEPVILYVMTDETHQVDVKTLTTKLRELKALSSQVIIEADMIQVKGTSIFSSENKILQSYVDYTGYATEEGLKEVKNTADDANKQSALAALKASNAETSAGNAATSASNAETKAGEAADSLKAVEGKVEESAKSALEAAASVKAVEGKVEASAKSASDAATSAGNAETSAGNAATSASNAETSAGNAATSASNAETKAKEAATSASNASTSASNSKTLTDNFIAALLKDPSKWNGTTIIDGGFIKTDLISAEAIETGIAAADKIMLAHEFISNKYIDSKGKDGFYMDGETGNFIVNNGTFRGDIVAYGLTFSFKPGNVILGELQFIGATYQSTKFPKKDFMTAFKCKGQGIVNIHIKELVVGMNGTTWYEWGSEDPDTWFAVMDILVNDKVIYKATFYQRNFDIWGAHEGLYSGAVIKNIDITGVALNNNDTIRLRAYPSNLAVFTKRVVELDKATSGGIFDIRVEKDNPLLAYMCGFDDTKPFEFELLPQSPDYDPNHPNLIPPDWKPSN